LARRLFPQDTRTRVAVFLGLDGFDTASAQGTRIPTWAKSRRRTSHLTLDGVNYIGDLRADMGLSENSRLIASTLLDQKIPLAYLETPYPLKSRTNPAPVPLAQNTPYHINIIDVNYSYFYDTVMELPKETFLDRYNIAIWFWELDPFPVEWRKNFRFVDEVWVASRYSQDIIAQVSPIPIIRMPPSIQVSTSPIVNKSSFGLPENRFIFLYSFNPLSSVARKNPFGFIESFRRAFGQPTSGPLLVLKTHHLDMPNTLAVATVLREAVASVNGVIIEQNLDRQNMNNLLGTSDCYVSLHRAEGFGLGMAEAMALGKPVIATAYSGNTDFMTVNNSYGVRYTIRAITKEDHALQPDFLALYSPAYKWAEPDLDHAANLMDYVYTHPEQTRLVGQRAAQDINAHYGQQVIGARITDRFRSIIQNS
jgi:glycosyltransferase involved in cell wall biosynthesis